jgi:hypothetical protein
MTPNFSARARPYPWHALPERTRDAARAESAFARALGAAALPGWSRVRRLLRVDAPEPIDIRLVAPRVFDPHAARCEVRTTGGAFEVRGSSLGIRAIVQRVLAGPDELPAPRPLDDVELAIWTLFVATALEDLGIAAHVWPSALAPTEYELRVELDIRVGPIALALQLCGAADLLVHAGTRSSPQAWPDRVRYELPLVAGRCALHRDDLARLVAGCVVTLEPPTSRHQLDLDVFHGSLGVKATEALPAVVTTGYVWRDMALPDDAHVELTVTAGTTVLTLRQITELAVGQIVQLHRPLGGPFELRAGGRVIGRGELVDVDGELAVRIVSLGDQEL